jgi:hypothetical protein
METKLDALFLFSDADGDGAPRHGLQRPFPPGRPAFL